MIDDVKGIENTIGVNEELKSSKKEKCKEPQKEYIDDR